MTRGFSTSGRGTNEDERGLMSTAPHSNTRHTSRHVWRRAPVIRSMILLIAASGAVLASGYVYFRMTYLPGKSIHFASGNVIVDYVAIPSAGGSFYAMRYEDTEQGFFRIALPRDTTICLIIPGYGAIILISGLPLLGLAWRRRRVACPNIRCMECGYNLTGNTSGRCPECGSAMDTRITGSRSGGHRKADDA